MSFLTELKNCRAIESWKLSLERFSFKELFASIQIVRVTQNTQRCDGNYILPSNIKQITWVSESGKENDKHDIL